MKKVFDDNSIYFKDWTTKKLKEEAQSYNELIYGEMPCYGTRDIRMYDSILSELDDRGVTLSSKLVFN